MKYLVLGNGAAGVTAAAKLRELDADSAITVVSVEDVPAYAKIMLPDYIGGKMEREKLFIRDALYYRKNNINFLTDKRVKEIDTSDDKVLFYDGTSEAYDKLLIATGSIPFIPVIKGLDSIHCFTVNSLKDADAIRNSIRPGDQAVLLGGGLTGIEMAFALQRLGMTACIVEREKALLPQQLDEEASEIMKGHMMKEGIQIFTGAAAAEIEAEDTTDSKAGELPQSGTLVLSDGKRMEFGMLIAAVGTRPGVDFIGESGIKINKGILVNEFLRTSVENVYAAGDVAEAQYGIQSGFVSPYIWPNAMAQGKFAAFNMIGEKQAFGGAGYAQNMTQLRDMQFVSMGMVKPKDDGYEILHSVNKTDLLYRKLVFRGNRLAGMILIGDVKKAVTLASFIRNETDVSAFRGRLLEPDFTL